MITYHTKTTKSGNIQTNRAVGLRLVGKKYPFVRTADKATNNNFEEFLALKEVSLDVRQGEILGIIGRNGAGKTTLLNIIAGVLSPTQGQVFVNGRILGLFNLGVGFQDELTGKENIFLNGALLGATRKELDNKLNLIIEFSELGDFIKMPLGTYSQGMRLRLGFSIIACLEFDILAMDEVLAVGDTLFQNKCFQRLLDFKRANKTLIITTQSMDLIERLCDKVALLDHGQLLFCGNTAEGVNKYRALINTEKFFVGPSQKKISLVEDTKKWADDRSEWGKVSGTKEVIIERVDFFNRLGLRCSKIKSGTRFRIKVYFRARNVIKSPHFGIAIFRNDGAYCYGPNTAFDGYEISEIKEGKGFFELDYARLLLAPGEYRVSAAVWDKNETLAFGYCQGYYKLIISGYLNTENELLNIPFKTYPGNYINFKNERCAPDLKLLSDGGKHRAQICEDAIKSVKLLGYLDEERKVFMANEPARLSVDFAKLFKCRKNCCLWFGIYRDDGIYCQGITVKIDKKRNSSVFFPKLPLLPGGYIISLGLWDCALQDFLLYQKSACSFRTVFDKLDHGTVYLEHKWNWR